MINGLSNLSSPKSWICKLLFHNAMFLLYNTSESYRLQHFFFFFLGERQPWSVTGGRWSSVLWWGQLGLDMVERGLENGNGKFSILKLSSPPLHKTTYLQVLTAYSLVQTYNLLNQCSGLLRGQQPNSHLATCSPHTGKSRTGMRKLTS